MPKIEATITRIIAWLQKAVFSAERMDDPQRMMSPAGGFYADMMQLALGPVHDYANDHPTNEGRQLTKVMRKYTPAVNLFYTKLGFDRLIESTVQRMADPNASDAFARLEEKARKEQGTRYWFQPGHLAPSRPPDLGRPLQ